MGRNVEVQNPKFIGGDIEKEDWEELEKIRWREHMERATLLRKIVQEYVKNHSAGNDTFKLDNWNNQPDFKAMPALMASYFDWTKFVRDNTNPKERKEMMDKIKHIKFQIETADKKHQIEELEKKYGKVHDKTT